LKNLIYKIILIYLTFMLLFLTGILLGVHFQSSPVVINQSQGAWAAIVLLDLMVAYQLYFFWRLSRPIRRLEKAPKIDFSFHYPGEY